MAESKSLIDLGNLTEPATMLIEKVCSAVGVVYEPWRIKRLAKAQAEIKKLEARTANEIKKSDAFFAITLNEIEQRGMERLIYQEARKQANIEAITFQAAALLPEDAKVEELEEDWLAYLFKNCDTVSDKDMQSLWSRLLSGEATKSGTFSKRTVDFIASVDKKDAELFTKFCQFCWFSGDVAPFILDSENNIYNKQGINFISLKHLDSIGLISFESTTGYIRKGFSKYIHISYFETTTLIEFNKDTDNTLQGGKVLLTQIGQELASVCGAERNNEFYEYIVSEWHKQGMILSTVLNQA